jgi:hypothetical protein
MRKLHDELSRAATDLGLQVLAPFQITLNSGRTLSAVALFPELGAPRGMIIVRSFAEIRDIEHELDELGYGFSVLDEPNDPYDLESLAAMFSDWGWSSDEHTKPSWMTDPSDEDGDVTDQ